MAKIIEIEVSYSLGGMNYFSSKVEPRGYWLHVQPVDSDGRVRTFNPRYGVKKFLEETKRYSSKRHDYLKDNLDPMLVNDCIMYIDYNTPLDVSEYEVVYK